MRNAAFAMLLLAAPAVAKAQTLAVSNEASHDISIIDVAHRQVVATISVGDRPRGIHALPGTRYVYVAISDNDPNAQRAIAMRRPAATASR